MRPAVRSEDRERGSIVLVMMMLLVITAIAGTLVTSALGGLAFSRSVASRNSALQASLAGGQAALAEIRAANNGNTAANANTIVYPELPCSILTGSTNASGGTTYETKIVYQEQTSSGSLQAVSGCTALGPTVDQGDHLAAAYIYSCAPVTSCAPDPTQSVTGSDVRRTVMTYDFKTTSANIPGGLIYGLGTAECLVAVYSNGSTAAGGLTLDTTTSCGASSPYAPFEQFQYTATWNLQTSINGVNYCVQDPRSSTSSSTPVTLTTTCSGNGAQWGVNDTAQFQDVNSSGQPGGYCLDNALTNVTTVSTIETPTTMAGCGSANSWQSAPTVGAGGAAPTGTSLIGPTDQFVNYDEFGRCMDVTNQNPGSSFLIDYTCKQFPDTTSYPIWNQRWCFSSTSTNANGSQVGVVYTPQVGSTSCAGTYAANEPFYCLQSPLVTATTSSTAFVTVTGCDPTAATPPAALTWTALGGTSSPDTSYTWTDADGYCLEANTANAYNPGTGAPAPAAQGATNGDWSTIQVDTCNGSFEQKWNAPATFGTSQVANIHEGTGTGTITGP